MKRSLLSITLAFSVALSALPLAAKTTSGEDTKWFTILGNAPLRKVFESALGLPSSIGALDSDVQLKTFKDKANAQLGSNMVSQFSDPTKVENLVRRFLVRSEAASFAASGNGNSALQMLQQISANARSRFT